MAPEGVRFNDIRNTISLDQEVAARLGGETRFPYLSLGGGPVSWNRKGVKVPSEERATQVFKQLFIDGTPEEVAPRGRADQDGSEHPRRRARARRGHWAGHSARPIASAST